MKLHSRTNPSFPRRYVPIITQQERAEPVTPLEWYVQGILFGAVMFAAIVLGATL